ncbi:MAG TPA: hypothetical protein VKG44_07880 [Candidatus Baltobacteraceae bacterium]|nr:hypothetical protein [Candidatus Baltobacteraceae bacterium]
MQTIALRSGVFGLALALVACSSNSTTPAPRHTPLVLTTTSGGYFQVVSGAPPVITIQFTGVGSDGVSEATVSFNQTITFGATTQITAGTFTFTYADGSSLAGTYSGSGPPPAANGLATANGNFTVTTGTGRYAGAAGSTGPWNVNALNAAPGSNPAGTASASFTVTL